MMRGKADWPFDPPPGGERRRRKRAAVLWTGRLECGGQVADCVLLDVGAKGARVRMAVPFERNLPVTLHCYHFGNLAGRVVWQDGNAIGLQFEDAPERVIEALGRALPELAAA
jgi:hypothetical protein